MNERDNGKGDERDGGGELRVVLPELLRAALVPRRFRDLNEAMGAAIDLGRDGAAAGLGGPFGARVVVSATLEQVAAGVNLVLASNLSALHAEVVALTLAQRRLGGWDLSAADLTLVTSCEPCLMCLGATLWSGVRRLVCGARGVDAEAAGFDEGPKPDDWPGAMRHRGIEVVTGVQRERARAVLAAYAAAGGVIYSPGA